MALLTFLPPEQQQQQKHKQKQQQQDIKQRKKKKESEHNAKPKPKPKPKPPSSWDSFKNLLSCKQIESSGGGSAVHDPSKKNNSGGACGSICSFRDVVHGNTMRSRVVHRADNSPESSSLGQDPTRRLLNKKSGSGSNTGLTVKSTSGSSYSGSSSRGMQFRKFSSCYECHSIIDPSRYPLPRTTICACPDCGEVFPKIESLEHHQSIRHAVSELGPEDSSRNIVEIIFKSSWLKKDSPLCKIERILKVHNTQRTIQRFEDCRDAVKSRAAASGKKNPRCAADGNELLRFYCTSLTCALGARGASSLCGSLGAAGGGCGVCTIIRHGFAGGSGIRTTASSGRAHDCHAGDGRRAMLVCRVIAGRVRRVADDQGRNQDFNIKGGNLLSGSSELSLRSAPANYQGRNQNFNTKGANLFSGSSGPSLRSTPEDKDNEHVSGAGLSAAQMTVQASSFDSVAGYGGMYSNLEELYVFNPKAILPCFVVIYKVMES